VTARVGATTAGAEGAAAERTAPARVAPDEVAVAPAPEDGLLIRDLTSADLEPTLAIFNQAVAETTSTWRWSPRSPEEWAEYCRVRQLRPYSALVAEAAGRVVGYATTGPFRDADGYRATAEHAIYVAPDHHGHGVGRRLLTALIEDARRQRLHVLIGALDSTNDVSAALHAKLGFVEVARLPQIGQKFGLWRDLTLWQLILDDRPSPPTV